jgi:hypothetical protein
MLTHYCAGDKIDKNEMGGNVARMGEVRDVYRVLVGKYDKETTEETGVDGG